MVAVLDANFVICPSENALLDASATMWVKDRAKAGVFTRDRALELTLSVEWPHGRRHIAIWRTNVCACCGKHPHQAKLLLVDAGRPRQWRCEQHVGRNPCLAPGCGRTRASTHPSLDTVLCGAHWRLVPPRMKRVYQRLWRLEKKSGGWTTTLNARYWRVWARMATAVRRRLSGEGEGVDMADIEKMFGL